MNINLHIERLILDGLAVSSAQGSLLGAAVETELARLVGRGGLEATLQSGCALPSVPVSVVQLTAGKPAQLGQQIAQAVYGAIGQKQSTSKTKQGGTHGR